MGEAKRRGAKAQRVADLLTANGVAAMTPERYNAFVAWTRSPIANDIGKELEFFSSADESLIGVVIKDLTDRDFGYVLLGRDLKGRFRCIDVDMSFKKTAARHALFASVKRHVAEGKTVFDQGDEATDKAGIDLFTIIAPEDKLHRAFQILQSLDHWIPARGIMTEMMKHYVDVDGNFVEQFQTTAFDSRIWELYLYAALLEMGLFVNKDREAPDFEVHRHGKKVFIEAVIVGPSPKDPPLELDENGIPELRSPEAVRELLKTRMPIRFGSALYSKLSRAKPYWELEHVRGHPLVFAVADFHEDQSMTWTSPALMEYLYGVTHDFMFDDAGQLVISPLQIETHEYNGKVIPSGFFLQPCAENVSAVLFSASGTISKFNRMGKLAGFGLPNQIIRRFGVRHDHNPNAALPKGFMHDVQQGDITESWAEGLSMYHNPSATHSVDPELFPGIAHHFLVDGQIRSILPEFHPYSSFTWNIMVREGDEIG
ncbi:hypothetical protein [Paracidovorax wautersii]|uniref:Glycosaminoglycan attachment site n=1 Tax=Paracidovorax wautersii TaxID=1177982 RepID=A0ABU1I7M0_9BURK|nr:hypothetical protein [Paracidovorax wautersii]MDR6213229.1 hypothetical protein [Paracidovorax wautersii]